MSRYDRQVSPVRDRSTHTQTDLTVDSDVGGPLSQDPTACLRPLPAPTPVPTSKLAVLGAEHDREIELVSVPPVSDTPHTMHPPMIGRASRHGRDSGPTLQEYYPQHMTGQCSLERR
jgi:hypothetical protein